MKYGYLDYDEKTKAIGIIDGAIIKLGEINRERGQWSLVNLVFLLAGLFALYKGLLLLAWVFIGIQVLSLVRGFRLRKERISHIKATRERLIDALGENTGRRVSRDLGMEDLLKSR